MHKKSILSIPISINDTGDAPHATAILDVKSTTKGVLVPRLTSTEYNAITSPATGLLVYDETNDVFVFYNGTTWVALGGGGTGTDDQTLSFSGTNLSIEDGNSVDLASLQDGTGTDNQDLSFSGTLLSIEDGAGVDLSSLQDGVNDADADPMNEIQDISLSGTDLSISDGSTIDLSSLQDLDEISDADGDTKVQVEENSDEDRIRFDLGGEEKVSFRENVHGLFRINISTSNSSNTFIGDMAGANTNSPQTLEGNFNTFIGNLAGIDNTIGSKNTFLGNIAGRGNTTGSSNTFVGHNAGIENEDGMSNTFIGTSSAIQARSGSYNTFVGEGAGRFVTGGTYNTYIGRSAGFRRFSGERNTILGSRSEALGASSGGSDNVFIGFEAGRIEGGSHKLYIENSSSSSPLIYGEFDNDILRINGELQIGTEYSLPLVDGSANQFLQTNGSGTLSWASIDQTMVEDGDGDTKIQVEENVDDDQIRFDIGGTESLIYRKNASGLLLIENGNTATNTFFGLGAGSNTDSLNGTSNTFFGVESGRDNTSGDGNTFIGYKAGFDKGSGDDNTFVGSGAGESMTGSSDNTMIGQNAGTLQTSGGSNTYVGQAAAVNRMAGSKNTIVGSFAGATGSGHDNVFLGYEAGYSEQGDNKLYISNSRFRDPLIYGEFDNEILRINGELQVGTEYAFPLTDGSDENILVSDGSGQVSWGTTDIIADDDGTTKIQVEEGNNDNVIRFDASGIEAATMTHLMTTINHPTSGSSSDHRGLRIHNSGTNANYWNLYTTNSLGTLELYSKNGGSAEVVRIENDGDIDAKSFNPTSDFFQKKNITSIDPTTILQTIEDLPISKWQYIGDDDYHIGPMAQDFYAAFGLGKSDKSINLLDGQGVALAAIQALKKENDGLKEEVQRIKKLLDQLLEE